MSNITFLTKEEIYEREDISNRSEIFEKYGKTASISDFAILLGGYVSDNNHSSDGDALENRTGYYWTRTDDGDNDARVVYYDGISSCKYVTDRTCGCRPALPYSSISSISSNKVRERDGLLEVEYREYPQKAVDKNLQKTLEKEYSKGRLGTTVKTYTTDSRKYDEYSEGFRPQTHTEYEYNGKKYIRVKANSYFDDCKFTLSNKEQYKNGDYVWVEVLPIKWLVDEKKDIAITKNIIIAGIQFNKERNYKGDFEKTDIYKFLNNIFIKDIVPGKILDSAYEIVYDSESSIKRERLEELLLRQKRALREYHEAIRRYNEAYEEYENASKLVQECMNEYNKSSNENDSKTYTKTI